MKEVNRFLSSRIFEDDGGCRVRVDDRRHQGDKGLGEKKGWKERKTLSRFDRTTAKRLYYGNEATVSRGWCAEEQGEILFFIS